MVLVGLPMKPLRGLSSAHPEIQFIFLFDRKYSKEVIFGENIDTGDLVAPYPTPCFVVLSGSNSGSSLLEKDKTRSFPEY